MPSSEKLNSKKSITFPPCSVQEEIKLNRFLTNISEFMDVDLLVEKVTIIQVTVPENRLDVSIMISRVKLNEEKRRKGEIPQETTKKKEKE